MVIRRKEINGIIRFLHLEDLWNSFTESEKEILTQGHENSPIEGDFSNSCVYPLGYIWGEILWADAAHDYVLADKLIHYGERIYISSKLIDKHFFLNAAAENYYKQRDIRSDALSLCEHYCLKDVELYEKHYEQVSDEWHSLNNQNIGFDGRIESYKRLAILYEKTNRYQEAIRICESAIMHNQKDGTKGGFESRIEKLRKKCK